jgi:Fur family zinc uptake transcriptional regulator
VYRALDFLQQHGLVHRIASLNAFVGCTHTDKNHHGLFLICRCCGNVLELTAPGVSDAVQSAAADEAFQPDNMTIEVSGICPGCKSDTAHD